MYVDRESQDAYNRDSGLQAPLQVQPPEVAQQGAVVDFAEPPVPTPCTYNECTNGHKFPPLVQVAKCPGCGQAVLAVKMVNCPICNEPVVKLALRSEHLPQGGSILPLCQGSATLNEVIQLGIMRSHFVTEQTTHKEREMISKV